MMSGKSDVWKYFQKSTAEEATCTSCLSTIKCKGSSTSGMRNHLKVKHNIILKTEDKLEINSTPKKTTESISQTITNNKREHLEEILSRLAAVDMISIQNITNSKFIRSALMDRGFNMPDNKKSIMKLIINYYNKKKSELCGKLYKTNEKYSLTFDELTSNKMSKGHYLKINLHDANNNWYNLGLVRCFNTITQDVIVKHLNDFGLNFYTDIVACTKAKTNEYLKFESGSLPDSQLCINYSIHLAINDALFVTDNNSYNDESTSEEEWEEEYEIRYLKNVEYSLEGITKTINAVRNIIKIFRKGTVENIVLQENIKIHFGKEMVLIMDNPTRWNTLDTMIERFLLLKEPIKTSLIKFHLAQLYVDVNEILLNDLRQTISPVKVAVEALNNKEANLLTAEAVVLFLFDTLCKLDTKISALVLNELKQKIGERRNMKLSTFIKYLHNPLSILQQDQYDVNLYASKPTIINYTKELMDKISNCEKTINSSNVTVKKEKIEMESDAEMTLKEQFELAIKASLSQNAYASSNDINSINREFTMYEQTGKRTSNLDFLYKAVSTVRPTATDIEHVFSLAGTFKPKLNSYLSDQFLNALIFLKYYFLQRDEVQ